MTFSGESATGWQQATFAAPVPVAANTTYVASYYAPVGRYSSNGGFFAATATTRGPLTALPNGTDGGNGIYRYGASGLPTSTYQSTNYWVDVVFATTAVDTTAPAVAAKSPAAGSDSAPTSTAVTATFTENVVAGSVTFQLTGPSGRSRGRWPTTPAPRPRPSHRRPPSPPPPPTPPRSTARATPPATRCPR